MDANSGLTLRFAVAGRRPSGGPWGVCTLNGGVIRAQGGYLLIIRGYLTASLYLTHYFGIPQICDSVSNTQSGIVIRLWDYISPVHEEMFGYYLLGLGVIFFCANIG